MIIPLRSTGRIKTNTLSLEEMLFLEKGWNKENVDRVFCILELPLGQKYWRRIYSVIDELSSAFSKIFMKRFNYSNETEI